MILRRRPLGDRLTVMRSSASTVLAVRPVEREVTGVIGLDRSMTQIDAQPRIGNHQGPQAPVT